MTIHRINLFFLTALEIALTTNNSFGQALKVDNTLGNENSIIQEETIINGIPSNFIQGGAIRGVNLFHSFSDFGVDQGKGVYFNNPSGIQRIITRVTGGSSSKIMGIIGIYGGNSDFFLINPNGIIFGPSSSLDLKGSFLASTASSITFDDTQYSAKNPDLFPLLSVKTPLGLDFRKNQSGSIINQSQVNDFNIGDDPIGLRVSQGKTLTLLGGDITLDGGVLSAPNGLIELGSVIGKGEVLLNQKDGKLDYQNIQNFGDIKLQKKSFLNSVDSEGSSGNINIQGKNLNIIDGSVISTLGFSEDLGGTIKIVASDSILIESNADYPSVLIAGAIGSGDGGNVQIETNKLVVNKGGFIQSASTSTVTDVGNIPASGNAGNVIIAAKDIEISGGAIFASTFGEGKGGGIIITSDNSINLSEEGVLSTASFPDDPFINGGGAGEIILKTNLFTISNSSVIVDSKGTGAAGNLEITAQSILLENKSFLSAQSTGGNGNINLYSNSAILQGNSSITTSATGTAIGGNVNIVTGVLAALGNSDIRADAEENFGGRVSISARGIFGTQFREELTSESDIIVSSKLGPDFSGTVELNITAVDPNQGVVELPATVVDPKTLVAQNSCRRSSSSEFTRSGRGGLPPSISQDLNGQSTQVGLVEPTNLSAAKPEPQPTSTQVSSVSLSSSQIAPAKGWVYNDKGEVVLVAYNSAVTGPQRLQSTQKGCPVL